MKNIIFIYNANSGLISGMIDSAHKLLSPDTYECELCALTHGIFGAKRAWKDFMARIGVETTFYHRNDAPAELTELADASGLPCVILANDKNKPVLLLDKTELASLNSLDALIAKLEAALK
ncbi:MAG: hypothetical protein R8L53_06900 [Mariprofundales bacterium]